MRLMNEYIDTLLDLARLERAAQARVCERERRLNQGLDFHGTDRREPLDTLSANG